MGDGLNALSEAISPSPEPDNWSYQGQTLDDNGGVTPNPLQIPESVTVRVGETVQIPLSGGKAPYEKKITTPTATPDTTIATATISASGATLEITGVSVGNTKVTIKDSRQDPGPRKVTIFIAVINEGDLIITPANIVAIPNNPVTVSISGGTSTYNISTEPDNAVAGATLADSAMVVTGIAPGETYLIISDSSPEVKTATLKITIGTESTELGSCTVQGETLQNMSKNDCDSVGGAWISYNSSANPTVTLDTNKDSIQPGQHAILTWDSNGANSCSATWTTSTSPVGAQRVDPERTTTYSITCSNNSGVSGSDSATIRVSGGAY
jgi:hypothetical protein